MTMCRPQGIRSVKSDEFDQRHVSSFLDGPCGTVAVSILASWLAASLEIRMGTAVYDERSEIFVCVCVCAWLELCCELDSRSS